MSSSAKHDDLLPRIADYLSRQCDCGPRVLVNPGRRFGLTGPLPDVFAWRDALHSWDADAKMSEADARQHMRKPHVIDPTKGPGAYRVLVCAEYLIEPTASYMPEWMGLWWIGSEGIYEVREPQRIHRRAMHIELGLALTAWTQQAWHSVGGHAKAAKGRGKPSGLTGPQLTTVKRAFQACNYAPLTAVEIKRATGLPMSAKKLADLLEQTEGFKVSDEMGIRGFELVETAKTEAA